MCRTTAWKIFCQYPLATEQPTIWTYTIYKYHHLSTIYWTMETLFLWPLPSFKWVFNDVDINHVFILLHIHMMQDSDMENILKL